MSWFIMALKKYAIFDGRARRKEYWYFHLFLYSILSVLLIIDFSLGLVVVDDGTRFGILSLIVFLATLLPSIAVSVRRLHDMGRSGWEYLIVFVPLVGPIILIVSFARRGNVGENRFGADPIVNE